MKIRPTKMYRIENIFRQLRKKQEQCVFLGGETVESGNGRKKKVFLLSGEEMPCRDLTYSCSLLEAGL